MRSNQGFTSSAFTAGCPNAENCSPLIVLVASITNDTLNPSSGTKNSRSLAARKYISGENGTRSVRRFSCRAMVRGLIGAGFDLSDVSRLLRGR